MHPVITYTMNRFISTDQIFIAEQINFISQHQSNGDNPYVSLLHHLDLSGTTCVTQIPLTWTQSHLHSREHSPN